MAANITVHSIDYFSWQITIYRLRVHWLLRLYLEDFDLECDTKLHFRIKKNKAAKIFQASFFYFSTYLTTYSTVIVLCFQLFALVR